ncbi:MAG: hypothetical protein A2W31_11510 [Planctomycetes bacterium RBG_16_64_10]|nr:MAG: hypothetical protein A2W31_11510 [Planctomycetes bacterium RBG_16_64_10]
MCELKPEFRDLLARLDHERGGIWGEAAAAIRVMEADLRDGVEMNDRLHEQAQQLQAEAERLRASWLAEQTARREEAGLVKTYTATKARAEIERLTKRNAALAAMDDRLWDAAERLGYSRLSPQHASIWLVAEVERLRDEIGRLRAARARDSNPAGEYFGYCWNCGRTVRDSADDFSDWLESHLCGGCDGHAAPEARTRDLAAMRGVATAWLNEYATSVGVAEPAAAALAKLLQNPSSVARERFDRHFAPLVRASEGNTARDLAALRAAAVAWCRAVDDDDNTFGYTAGLLEEGDADELRVFDRYFAPLVRSGEPRCAKCAARIAMPALSKRTLRYDEQRQEWVARIAMPALPKRTLRYDEQRQEWVAGEALSGTAVLPPDPATWTPPVANAVYREAVERIAAVLPPAGETWRATRDGVLAWAEDVVARLAEVAELRERAEMADARALELERKLAMAEQHRDSYARRLGETERTLLAAANRAVAWPPRTLSRCTNCLGEWVGEGECPYCALAKISNPKTQEGGNP